MEKFHSENRSSSTARKKKIKNASTWRHCTQYSDMLCQHYCDHANIYNKILVDCYGNALTFTVPDLSLTAFWAPVRWACVTAACVTMTTAAATMYAAAGGHRAGRRAIAIRLRQLLQRPCDYDDDDRVPGHSAGFGRQYCAAATANIIIIIIMYRRAPRFVPTSCAACAAAFDKPLPPPPEPPCAFWPRPPAVSATPLRGNCGARTSPAAVDRSSATAGGGGGRGCTYIHLYLYTYTHRADGGQLLLLLKPRFLGEISDRGRASHPNTTRPRSSKCVRISYGDNARTFGGELYWLRCEFPFFYLSRPRAVRVRASHSRDNNIILPTAVDAANFTRPLRRRRWRARRVQWVAGEMHIFGMIENQFTRPACRRWTDGKYAENFARIDE